MNGANNDRRLRSYERFGHHKVIHYKPATNVEGDGLGDCITVPLVGGNGPALCLLTFSLS